MKNSLKRVVALAVVAVMLLCMAPMVYAADFAMSVGSADAQPGDSISIDINIDELPFASIGGISIKLAFDTSALEYTGYTESSIVPNASDYDIAESEPGLVFIGFSTADQPVVEAGTLVTINFNVKSDAANGSYALTATPGSKVTDNELNIVVSKADFANCLIDGTVTVTGGTDAPATPDEGEDETTPDEGEDDTTPDEDEEITILEVKKVYLKVGTGLSASDVLTRLPSKVTVTCDKAWNGSSKTGEMDVTWSMRGAGFVGSQPGDYTFEGEVAVEDGFILDEDVIVEAIVTVQKSQSSQGSTGIGIGTNPVIGAIVSGEDEDEESTEIRFVIGGNSFTANGKTSYMDVQFMYNEAGDRTLVPVRFISEVLGYTVAWDDATKTVTITKDNDVITLIIDNATMYKNGAAIQMDTAPVIYNDRTFVPIRFVAENFGLVVGFDDATQEVTLTSK